MQYITLLTVYYYGREKHLYFVTVFLLFVYLFLGSHSPILFVGDYWPQVALGYFFVNKLLYIHVSACLDSSRDVEAKDKYSICN